MYAAGVSAFLRSLGASTSSTRSFLMDSQVLPAERSLPRHALCVFGTFFALFMLTSAPRMLDSGDSGIILNIAAGILEQGPRPDNKWGIGQVILDLSVVKALLAARTAPPDVRIFYSLMVAALAACLSAMAPCLVFLIASRLGYRLQTALVAAFSVGLGTITWTYSQTLFSEPTIAASWLLAIFGLTSFARTREKRWLILAGAAAGFGLLTKNTAALVMPLIVLYCLVTVVQQLAIASWTDCVRHRSAIVGALLAVLVPMLICLAVVLWYNYARYGGLFETGYNAERDGSFGFNTPVLVGLFGLTLSTGKGFFFYSPVAVLGLKSGRFYRAHKNEAVLLWAMIVVTLLVHVRWWAWHGDWCWGPRFLVPLAPLFGLLSLGVIDAIGRTASTWQRSFKVAGVGALLLTSIGVQTLGLCFEPSVFIKLASAEARVLGGGFYNAARWPIRDDGLVPHFIPELSPLAGHAWMLRIVNSSREKTRRKLLAHPPWATLNPLWVPESITSFNPEIQLWWAEAKRSNHPHLVALQSLALLLLLVFFLGSAWLVRESYREHVLDCRS